MVSLLLLMMMMLALLCLPGCEVAGFVAQGIVGDRSKIAHELEDVPTVVLVDDPNNQLAGASGVLAERVGYDLVEKNVLKKQHLVSSFKVRDLQARLGEAFYKSPIDQIGRELGAEQVIHVNVEEAGLIADPGVVQPTGTVAVKVISVTDARRVFPADAPSRDMSGVEMSRRGYPVSVSLKHYMGLQGGETGERTVLARRLADQMGIEVGRLFYRYTATTTNLRDAP